MDIACMPQNISRKLRFLTAFSDINMDNTAKFREVNMPRRCISENWDFQDFGL